MRRSGRRLVLALVAYAVLLVGSVLLLQQEAIADSGWRFAVALLPLPAAAGVAAATVAAYHASDELGRQIQLQALAGSFLGTMLVAFTWGLLEGVGLPALSGFVYFAVLWALYLPGLWWANRRYR